MTDWIHEEAKKHTLIDRLLERCVAYAGSSCAQREALYQDWCERCLAADELRLWQHFRFHGPKTYGWNGGYVRKLWTRQEVANFPYDLVPACGNEILLREMDDAQCNYVLRSEENNWILYYPVDKNTPYAKYLDYRLPKSED